jgi:predicted nucleic acid-binding protein
MPIVADASVTVAWFVKAQATADTDRLLDRAMRETVHVPPLWLPEFVNALVSLERRRRLPVSEVDDALQAVADFDIVTERDTSGPAALAALARRYALTAYDATYLNLALRLKLPFACKDASLRAAAGRAGVKLA